MITHQCMHAVMWDVTYKSSCMYIAADQVGLVKLATLYSYYTAYMHVELTFTSCTYPASLAFSVWLPLTDAAEMERNTTQQKIASSFIFALPQLSIS